MHSALVKEMKTTAAKRRSTLLSGMSRFSFSSGSSPPRLRKGSRSNTISHLDKPKEHPLSTLNSAKPEVPEDKPESDKLSRFSVSDLPHLDLHNQEVSKLVEMLEQVLTCVMCILCT